MLFKPCELRIENDNTGDGKEIWKIVSHHMLSWPRELL